MQYPHRVPQLPKPRKLSRPFSKPVFEIFYADDETDLHQIGLFPSQSDVIDYLRERKVREPDLVLLANITSLPAGHVICASVPHVKGSEFQVSYFNVRRVEAFGRITFLKV